MLDRLLELFNVYSILLNRITDEKTKGEQSIPTLLSKNTQSLIEYRIKLGNGLG